jgi:hypothetical protein
MLVKTVNQMCPTARKIVKNENEGEELLKEMKE